MMGHKIILIAHIAFGFSALSLGIIPMILKKGGRAHIFWGNIYVYSMYGVSLSALGLFLLNPQKIFLQFLLCIAILSFYLTFTGVRAVQKKKNKSFNKSFDWIISVFVGLSGIASFGNGVYHWIVYSNINSVTILFMVFGLVIMFNSFNDLKSFRNPENNSKMQWFFNHLTRMLGAYIATFTAFCVVNNHFLPDLVAWILPGIIGGIFITFTVKHYKQKFQGLNLV
jgi:uncharacterized membrane protein